MLRLAALAVAATATAATALPPATARWRSRAACDAAESGPAAPRPPAPAGAKLPYCFPVPTSTWDANWDFRAPAPAAAPQPAPPAAGSAGGGPPAAEAAPAPAAAAPASGAASGGSGGGSSSDTTGKAKHASSKSAGKPTATRHILLIRHGQYFDTEEDSAKRVLTPLGRQQAALVARRMVDLIKLPPITSFVCSTMPRAIETATIMAAELAAAGWPVGTAPPSSIVLKTDELLEEGYPIPPSPPTSSNRPLHLYWKDGPRIEAAFRKYFHRASPSQTQDSLDVIVCHANVIRYFVVRALQLPPEAWLRISLPHASMTLITIRPSGNVALRFLGDAGFIPGHLLSS